MDLFPAIDATASGLLPVGDGHEMYWEVAGNPNGPAVVFIHGGPGAGIVSFYRRFFDPSFWRIVLFDQRGCGQSRPYGGIEANTTGHLVADMELLRRHLGIERWLLFGGSWGSTLALAYGQSHPERCTGFILRGIFLCRPFEVEWFMSGMGYLFPEAWHRFMSHLTEEERADPLVSYVKRLNHPDPEIHLPASKAWCNYEGSCARLIPGPDDGEGGPNLPLARLEAHYMIHNAFLAPNQLLDNMPRIRKLPGIIVQGRYDAICPAISAYDLSKAWPVARLQIMADAGHSATEPSILSALVEAGETMKALV
jgi:proline iminopeptidase